MSPVGSLRTKPLYEKFKNEFETSEELMSLAAKKKRLEELRAFNKPVTKADIAEHALKYEKTRLEKIEA